jgi:hypothetical protein
MGSDAKGMFAMPTLGTMQEVVSLNVIEVRQFGNDIRLLARSVAS